MPKKRHQNKYSKPQSTAPASLSSSSTSSHHGNVTQHQPTPPPVLERYMAMFSANCQTKGGADHQSHGRQVNELLADLRRAGPSANRQHHVADLVSPSVPPAIRQILQLPETPPPRPRRPVRTGPGGVRLPAGPAPPRSWLSGPGRTVDHVSNQRGPVNARDYEHRPLPGMTLPGRGNLIDMILRRFALDWEWQRSYCRYHLYDLPTHLRVALLAYLVRYAPDGVSIHDLEIILLPAPDLEPEDAYPVIPPSIANASFRHLDLSNLLGRSLRLRELSDLLFPPQPTSPMDPQESWDQEFALEDEPPSSSPSIPCALLPNLTHLSLALSPDLAAVPNALSSSTAQSPLPSWRHLLSLASHLGPSLTHLSLAFWPEPTLTPNAHARLAAVVSPHTGRNISYGGTGFYSHSLDDDWAEAVLVLRRLSRCLYRLEYLDLTGCGGWAPALWAEAPAVDGEDGGVDGEGKGGRDMVDWVGAWGKMQRLVLYPGYGLRDDAGAAETESYWRVVDHARRLERHARGQRQGKGSVFGVETVSREGT